MNLKSLLSTALVMITFTMTSISQNHRNCGTMHYLDQQKAQDPGLEARMEQIETQTRQLISQGNEKTGMVVTIPVVFHVLYNTASLNISDARILAQLDVLNKDFARLNADANNTPAAFQGVSVNTNIQFCLAQRDPNGNPTTGIVRRSTTVSAFSSNNAMKFTAQGGSDAWNTSQYLNVWVCNLSGGLLGYAQFPGGSASTDGVVLLTGSVGGPSAPGTSVPYHLGRTGTHEVGHYLNLRHIWGDANCGSDLVSDTPTQQTSNYGCPSFPKVTCSNGPNGDMFMNYMDYTDDGCMNMFTAGQASRMNAAITSSRPGLLTSLGCVPPNQASCGTPTGLAATNVTTSSATLNWAAVTGATSYNVQYRSVGTVTLPWISTTSTGTSVGISGLSSSTSYEFQVQANCNGTLGSFSASGNFTTSGSGTTCGTPSGLSATSVTSSSATLNWAALSGATGYNYRYKTVSSTTWTNATATGTSANISSLTASTAYEFQVQANCSGTLGGFSTSGTFTTVAASGCTDPYESNNTSGTAKILTTSQLNTNLTATIGSSTDVDWYRFTTVSGATRVKVNLSTLPFDYDVYLYSSNASTVLGSGTLTGTSSEQIIRNATKTGTYFVRVIGYQGAFSTSSCYTLRISTSGTNWRLGDQGQSVAVESIDASQVFVSPNPTSGNTAFEFVSDIKGEASVTIADMLGRVVYQNSAYGVSEGPNAIEHDMTNASKGMHFIIIEINGERKTGRFIVD
jgi:hypothetical protein